jgi:transposase
MSRDDLSKLARMRRESVLAIPGIGEWQRQAKFSQEAEYVGPQVSRAKRILELLGEIAALEVAIVELSRESEIARRLDSIPGVDKVSSAELAGEIGTFDRFTGEASLALYLGMCPLDNQSGQFHGAYPVE